MRLRIAAATEKAMGMMAKAPIADITGHHAESTVGDITI
jgi:hypothetical protein